MKNGYKKPRSLTTSGFFGVASILDAQYGCGEGISSCFLQSNLQIPPTYALQKSSVTAKTVGGYRFLTLFQNPSLSIA